MALLAGEDELRGSHVTALESAAGQAALYAGWRCAMGGKRFESETVNFEDP